MKVIEENNFMKFVESFHDGCPVYSYLSFDYIENWRRSRIQDEQFGNYGFAVAQNNGIFWEKSGYIWIGAEGTCIVYDRILYENEADYEKLILKLEQEHVAGLFERM